MFFLLLLIKKFTPKSSTDCFPNPSFLWERKGQHRFDQGSLFDSKHGNQSSVEYKSTQFRKKWMISICGIITNSNLRFEVLGNQKDYNICIIEHYNSYMISLTRNNEIIESKEIERNSSHICWKVLSGRGFFGLFLTDNIRNQKPSPIFLSKLDFPRKHKFTYQSNGFSNLTALCVGDYLGNNRISIEASNDQWDSNINDFL